MDPKDFERLISGERFKNQAGSMTAEPLGRESYRSESALSGTVAMTPEEKAMDIRTNQNPAVFEELEREYRNAKDPKVKAILGEEIQRQLSQKSGLPAIGGLGLQGSGVASLVGPAFPSDSRALPDFAGEKSRRDAQAASDESPISTSLGRGWERTKQMAGDTFNLLTGDAEGIRQNALDWQKYDEANPMPTSAKEFSEGHQAAGDSVGAMLKNAAGNLGGLGLSSVEQITNSLPSMAGSIAGSAVGAAKGFAVGGPLGALAGSMVGGIIGATPGSMMIEPGAKVAEAMAESGVDLANPDAVKSWFSANQGELIEKGLLKAGGVAAVDGLMGGIGQAIVAKPALAFAAAQNRALAKIGVNAGDKAAVAAARQMPEYRALMAQPARDFLEATTVAKNAMRGTASFAAETLGEGAGEYWGEYMAEGEGNFNEAMLESLTAGITSVATTGAQYGASKVLFGPDQTVEEIKALAAIQSQEQKPAAPQPNSPLSNAAEAAKPVDPFAEMLAPITERLNDREIYGKIRGNEALGPDALGDILASYRVATNKNADPMQRQAAIDRLGEFFRAFDNMPNFTHGTPESSGQSSGLPVVAPTQGSGVGFVDPAAGSIDGEARTVADPLSLGDQPRLPAPPRRLPPPPPALIADSREAQRIVAEYEAAYQDLVKADQLGASDQELMQRQINLRNAEARLSELNQFIESRRQQETAIKRDALLSDVLATLQPGQNPLRAFDRALKQSGFTDTNFTEAEKAKIARFMDIAAAQDEQQAIPSAPNEAGDFGIPEKVVSRTPATNAVANMLNAGWQWDGGWNLVSPTGERYNLKAAERQFLKAQAAKTRVRKPIVSPSQQEQANDAALDEGSNQGQRADDAGGQGIARPGGIVPGGLLRGAAAPAQRGGADSALGNANTNGLGALNGLPATQQVAEEAPQANDAQAGAEQGAAQTGEVANAQPTSLPNQGATQAQPPAQATVVPAAVASQGAAPITSGRSLADRTDAQLTYLVTNGSTQEVRTAAKAEIDRRASAGVPSVVTGGQESAPATEERAPAKPLSQWTAEEIQARLDRGNLSPESEQKLRDLLATKPKPKATKPEAQISIGNAPGDAQPVTVRNGVIYIGEEPAIDYDTEQDVTIQEGATPQQIVDALKASGVIGRRKVFGLKDVVNAEVRPGPVAAPAQQETEPVDSVGAQPDRIYTPPASNTEASDRWGFGVEMTPAKIVLKQSVERALDSGLFSNRSVEDFVANELGVTAQEREIGAKTYRDENGVLHTGVEGGSFGYEVYHARKQVEREAENRKSLDAKERLALRVGENIGRIKTEGKIGSGATVESVGDYTADIVFSRGPNKYRITLPFDAIEIYTKAADNDYFDRKADGYKAVSDGAIQEGAASPGEYAAYVDEKVSEYLAKFEQGDFSLPSNVTASGKESRELANEMNVQNALAYALAAKKFIEGDLSAKVPGAKSPTITLEFLEGLRPKLIEKKIAKAKDLPAILKAIDSIASDDKDVRYYLRGIHFDPEGMLVATDGHRIAVVSDVDTSSIAKSDKGFTILGRDGKWIDGKFPDWRRVMPEASGVRETFNATELGNIARGIVKAMRYTVGPNNAEAVPMIIKIDGAEYPFAAQYIADMADLFRKMGYETFEISGTDIAGKNKSIIAESPDRRVRQRVMGKEVNFHPFARVGSSGFVGESAVTHPDYGRYVESKANAASKPETKAEPTQEAIQAPPKDQGASAFSEGKERKAPESFSAADKARWFAGYDEAAKAAEKASAVDAQNQAETEAKREEFTHNGVRIYPVRVNVGGVAQDMWGIESFENKAKREAGERHGFGDALVDTEKQAKEAADRLIRDERERAEYQAGVREREAEAARKKAAIEADTFNGFLDDKAPNVKALIRERLAKQWRFDGDKVMTARERIESLWKAGELSVSTYEENKIKPMSRAQFNRATQREQDAHDKKVREGGKVTVYQVNGSDLGKTAYDYAQHLLNQEVAAKREEPDSWMKEIFGDGANAAPAAAQPKRSIDMAGLVKSLRDFSQQKLAEANDWASRQYKQNNTQINLDGDGPTRNESMSVSAANESRRRRNVESLQQQAQFASNLANRIENGRNVQAEVEQAIRNADNDIARDGKPRFGGTRESQIEAYISNSMLGDANYGYGDGTVASVIRKAYDQVTPAGSEKREELQARIEAAEQQTNHDATPAQKEAGNYAKGKFAWNGLTVSVETAKGEDRTDKETNGDKWRVTMPATYGYILGTVGADKDHVDVFMGDSPESDLVFVVNQNKVDSQSFDEHKVMAGFASAKDARDAYLGSFEDGFGSRVLGSISGPYSIKSFREMLDAGSFSKAKPIGEAISPLSFVDVEVSGEQKPASVAVQEIDDQLSLAKQLLECVLS